MRIEKITFQQTFNTGQYENQKLGMEIIIEPHDFADGEIPQIKVAQEAYKFAKEAVLESFLRINPGFEFSQTSTPIPEVQVDKGKNSTIDGIIKEIEAATVISEFSKHGVQLGLKAYEWATLQDETIKAAYDKKLESLQNAQQ